MSVNGSAGARSIGFPTPPVMYDFANLPGFATEVSQEEQAVFAPVQTLEGMIEVNRKLYPHYAFDEETVKDRNRRRETNEAREQKLTRVYNRKLFFLKREKVVLKQLEQIDNNLIVLRAEVEETRKWTDGQALKSEKKKKRDAVRHQRNAAAIAAQDARRDSKRAKPQDQGDQEPEDVEDDVEEDIMPGLEEDMAAGAA